MQPIQDNLRWAAIQLLQQYQRCGISMVARGTDRWVDAWSESPTALSEVANSLGDEKSSLTKVAVPPQKTASPSTREPLPPMPLVPLKSASRNAAARGTQPAKVSTEGLQILSEEWLGPSLPNAERLEIFETLREKVAECRTCEELACSRTQTVFGVGAISPRVVFFGEAPGADEDRLGEPFVGAAGQLLNKIMAASHLKREEVYILNSLKCRPPGNRTPVDSEIENCRSFFEAQLDVLQPEFIVCLGAVAVRAVLQTTEPIGRLRGRFHRYRKAQVLVTYHPAYLLRTESAKKLVWDDMKMLMTAMGIQLPNA